MQSKVFFSPLPPGWSQRSLFSKYESKSIITWTVLKMCTPALPFLPLTTLSLPDKYMYLQI